MQAINEISGFLKVTVIISAAMILMTSCVKESFEMSVHEEGIPVNVTLPINTPGIMETMVTKANTYSNLASIILFIYNEDGTKCEKILESETGDITLSGGSEINNGDDPGRQYKASFTTTSGNKRICAIGNYEDVTNWEYYDRDTEQWGNFSEYIEKLKLQARNGMSSEELGRQVFFLNRVFSERGNTPTFDGWRMISTGSERVSIDTKGSVTNPETNSTGILHMKRCAADIQFRIQSKAVNNPDTDIDESEHNISFSPTSYTIYNIPSGLRLAPGRTYDDNPNEGQKPDESFAEFYYDGTQQTYFQSDGDFTTFQFFMPENIQKTLTSGENESGEHYDFTTSNGYQLRDAWDGMNETHKDWKFAPDNGTYVVITGEYSESDANNNHIYSGTTSYTVHLGNFGDGNWGDFTIRRNNRYIYTVTISGINNIKVEAETSEENQPGAEGNIISTETNVTRNFSLDAHFEQVFLEYNLTQIANAAKNLVNNQSMSLTDAIAQQMMLSIESPFHSRIDLQPYKTFMKYKAQNNNGDQAALKLAKQQDLYGLVDYKWVEFWPQTSDAITLAEYPGLPSWKAGENSTDNSKYLLDVYDICVKMGQVAEKIINTPNEINYYQNGNGVRGESIAADDPDGKGITVFRSGSDSNPIYYARFTGFIDEYYYTANPLDGTEISWNSFVNKAQRRMIISMDAQTSADGNSTYSTGHTNISQRSIQTFYNAGTTNLLTGIGVETFNETRPCQYGSPTGTGNDSYSDGRSNTISLIAKRDQIVIDQEWVPGHFEGWEWIPGHYEDVYGYGDPYMPEWDYYINAANNGYIDSATGDDKDRYLSTSTYAQGIYAYYACLSRNRDENGNGKIEEDEVRWYLPSINEYLRIGIGAVAMSNESALVGDEKKNMIKANYPNSYYDIGVLYRSSTSGKEIYWAAEKGASSPNSQSGHNYGNDNIPIRCIRSLPKDVKKINDISDPICDFHTLEGGMHLIDFRNKLVNGLYRDTPTWSAFIEHNEDDLQNRFYDGLVVSSKDLEGTFALSDVLNYNNEGSNPCQNHYEGDDPNDPVNGRGRWRVPNLVELTVMSTNHSELFSKNGVYYYASTMFSNTNTRIAYRNNNGQVSCHGGDPESLDPNQIYVNYIRCVRDATEEELNAVQE